MSITMPKQGEFCWNELLTSDANQAKTFYKDLFGWEYQENDFGHGKYNMITKSNGDSMSGGLMQIPAGMQGVPSHWMSYVTVEDLEQSVEKAKSLGATIKVPIMAVGDFGRLAIIIDPTGAHLGLWQCLKSCG